MNITILSKVESVVLLTGETGTGKTTLAKKIHESSSRRSKPFVDIDLAAISESLIESELFGHVKGSFSGAISDKVGFLSHVNGGTLFLDEIGEISLVAQKKLLKVIEKKEFYPVGSTKAQKFSGTIIAATHNELCEKVKEGKFRQDLYYRLNVFQHTLKPLRENPIFLKSLIFNIFNDFKVKFQKYDLILSQSALNALLAYDWKGNIRELKNVLEYVILTCNEQVLANNLPIKELSDCNFVKSKFHNAVMSFEKSFIQKSLFEHMGKINLTAEMIGISKVTLISKVKKYDINVEDIKLHISKAV